jgi:hypothetical protein
MGGDADVFVKELGGFVGWNAGLGSGVSEG